MGHQWGGQPRGLGEAWPEPPAPSGPPGGPAPPPTDALRSRAAQMLPLPSVFLLTSRLVLPHFLPSNSLRLCHACGGSACIGGCVSRDRKVWRGVCRRGACHVTGRASGALDPRRRGRKATSAAPASPCRVEPKPRSSQAAVPRATRAPTSADVRLPGYFVSLPSLGLKCVQRQQTCAPKGVLTPVPRPGRPRADRGVCVAVPRSLSAEPSALGDTIPQTL